MPHRKFSGWIALILGVLSAVEVGLFVSNTTPTGAFLSGETPLTFDYSLTTYLIEAGRRFHQASGHLWGYDPFFGAGYPQAFLEDNFPLLQAVAAHLPSIPAAVILLLSNAFLLAALPWILYFSIRAFGAGAGPSFAASLLGLTVLRVGEFSLFPMAGSVLAGFVQVWLLATCAVLYWWLRRPRSARTALLFLLVPLSLLFHKGAVVLFPPLFLAFLFLRSRARTAPFARSIVLFTLLGLATLAVNWFWLRPLLAYYPLRGTWPPPAWAVHDPMRILKDLFTPSGGTEGWPLSGLWGTLFARDALVALAAWGFVCWVRERGEAPWAPLLGTLGYLLWLTYFGSFVKPLMAFEPYRYVIATNLLLLPAAARALADLGGRFPRARWRWAAAVASLAVLIPNALPSYATFASRHPVRIGLEAGLPDVAALSDWIAAHPDPPGRIMIEDAWPVVSGPGGSPYRDSFPLTAIVLGTGRELTGSRSPNFRLRQRFSNFLDGSAFGRPLLELDEAWLARHLDLFNVVWVVAWSESAAEVLDSYASCLRPEATVGPFRVWRALRAKPSFFHVGDGEVSRVAFGEIDLADVAPDGGEVVLLYHWMDGLRSAPPLEIGPVLLADDPVPYVRVLSPPREFKLLAP